MTIDEAIEFYKGYNDRSGGTVDYNEFDEQLAEWLEELKAYQQYIDLTEMPKQYKLGFQDGFIEAYNKAIDDFVKFANTMPTVEKEDGEIRPMRLEEMAEQLKVGGKNDD